MSIEAMKQALEALENAQANFGDWWPEVITALRERLAQPEQEQWDTIPDAFNEWWNADYDDTGNPFRKDSPAYWAWSGWKAASKQPEQEPVAWKDVLGAIARGWTHDDNKHKTMDVQLAVAIAKEIQDMVTTPPQRERLAREEPDGRKLQRMRQEAWRKTDAQWKDDPELCFALGYEAGYNDAVAPRVEPRASESGAGFESLPASPTTQPEQEPIKESSVTHSHLWIGELWRKEKK